ncbi:MAG TPA: hypothetical protein VLZ30_03655, partial [Verrucomicrobiae bacterium]|nr:hypothetical protein [Verrucomicrobiae bacterium]
VVGNVATGLMVVSAGTVTGGGGTIGYAAGSFGTLVISNGATMGFSSLSIGQQAGATGAVWISSGQLAVTNSAKSTLYVGYTGVGQLTVSNGAALSSVAYVGYNGGSQGTLTVAGGTATISSALNIGYSPGATGAVWLTGGRLVNNGTASAIIGAFGNGQLTTTAGSMQAGSVTVGQNAGSHGSLTVSGGTISVFSSLVVGDCATTASGQVSVVSGGSLYVTNAGDTAFLDVRHGTLVVGTGGVVQVDKLVMTNACGLLVRSGGTLVVSNLVLDPNLSAVGDGIPNGWKQQYGLDPLDPTLAGKDLDGSGLTVYQDYLAGLDPTNPASSFRIISVVPSGIDLRVTWRMGSGKTNALQVTAGDANGGYNTNNFTDIFTVTDTVGTVTNYLDLGAATNTPSRFYRVRLVP